MSVTPTLPDSASTPWTQAPWTQRCFVQGGGAVVRRFARPQHHSRCLRRTPFRQPVAGAWAAGRLRTMANVQSFGRTWRDSQVPNGLIHRPGGQHPAKARRGGKGESHLASCDKLKLLAILDMIFI